MRVVIPALLSVILLASGAALGGGDLPKCKVSDPAPGLQQLFDRWSSATGAAKGEAGAAFGTCLASAGFPHLATHYWAQSTKGQAPEVGEDISRLWLPLELKLGPDVRSDGPLSQTPLIKVHRRERSRSLFLQNLLRINEGSYSAAISGLKEVSGQERGLARLLLGQALEFTQAPSQALGAFHSALSSLGPEADWEEQVESAKATRAKRLREIDALALKSGVENFKLPSELPPLVEAWLIPHPHAHARLGLGRTSLALGEPEAARAYLSTVLNHPTLASEAKLLTARAAIASGALATALSFLEPLSREGTFYALEAQLEIRKMSPQAKERAILFERSKSLAGRLNKSRDELMDAIGVKGAASLEVLRAQEVNGSGPIPQDLLTSLQGDMGLHLLRRRLQEIQLERATLRAMGEAITASTLGPVLWERLRHEEDSFKQASNARAFSIIKAWSKGLEEAQRSVPPSDLRDVLFSPSIIIE